jgi:hypothetical protein
MHFNDMLLRTRTLGLSTVLAIYGAGASATVRSSASIEIFRQPISAGVLIFGCGILLHLALLAIDRGYYYRMLLATAEYAAQLERESGSKEQPAKLGLSSHIVLRVSRRSASVTLWLFYLVPLVIGLLLLTAALMARS